MNKLLAVLLVTVSLSVSASSFEPDDRKAVDDIFVLWEEKVIKEPHKSIELMQWLRNPIRQRKNSKK